MAKDTCQCVKEPCDCGNNKTFGVTKQQMRLFDIFLFSPFLFWASSKTSNNIAKYGLITLGVTTILYNYINYKKAKNDNNK